MYSVTDYQAATSWIMSARHEALESLQKLDGRTQDCRGWIYFMSFQLVTLALLFWCNSDFRPYYITTSLVLATLTLVWMYWVIELCVWEYRTRAFITLLQIPTPCLVRRIVRENGWRSTVAGRAVEL